MAAQVWGQAAKVISSSFLVSPAPPALSWSSLRDSALFSCKIMWKFYFVFTHSSTKNAFEPVGFSELAFSTSPKPWCSVWLWFVPYHHPSRDLIPSASVLGGDTGSLAWCLHKRIDVFVLWVNSGFGMTGLITLCVGCFRKKLLLVFCLNDMYLLDIDLPSILSWGSRRPSSETEPPVSCSWISQHLR